MVRTTYQWWRPVPGPSTGPELAVASATVPVSTLPFAALMAFIVVSLIAPQSFMPALASLRIALLTAVVAIVALLIDRMVHRRPLVTLTRETWLAACLAGWASVSVAFSYWPGGSVAFLLDMYFKALAVFWLLGTVVDTRARLHVAAWTLSLTAVPLAVTGVVHFLSGVFVPEGVAMKRIIGYDAPLTENPNDFALMLNLILPLTVALLLIHRGRGVRVLLTGVVLVDGLAVILTFSRAGFLTLATTVGLYCWRVRKRPERGWAVVLLVMTVAAAPLLPSGYLDRLGTITSIESDSTGSAQERWNGAMAATAYVVTHPIVGAGVGMNVLALNEQHGPAWKAVHNVYLELAVDLGLPGLLLFLLLLLGSIRNVGLVRRRTAGNATAREVFHLAEGLEISLIAFAVAALFHPVAYNSYFYDLAGLGVALQAVSRTTCKANESGC